MKFLSRVPILVMAVLCTLQSCLESSTKISRNENSWDNSNGTGAKSGAEGYRQPCGAVEHETYASRIRYSIPLAPPGAKCSDYSQLQKALCSNGVLGKYEGDFTFESCEESRFANCDKLAHGESESRVRFQNILVPENKMCESQTQTRTCTNGVLSGWSGTYIESTCSVQGIKGNTIHAASLSQEDVQAACNLARTGDTVVIPAGTASWTKGVSWTAPPNVSLIGAGSLETGGGDLTVIRDDLLNAAPLLSVNVSSSGVFRLSGITFQSGSGHLKKDGGTININGPGLVRIDHVHLDMSSSANYKALRIGRGVRGVLDSSVLDFHDLNALYFYNGRSGAGESQGNFEWTQPTAFGTDDFFFIEDNIINGSSSSSSYSTRLWDGFTAAKVVARFNTLSHSCVGETHATGHASDDRGTRAQETYGNLVTSTLIKDPNYAMSDLSSGGALVWGNVANNVYKHMFTFRVTRANRDTYPQSPTPTGWGYAGTNYNGIGSMWDGGTALDTNLSTGYPAIDQPGRGKGDLLTGLFPNKINSVTKSIYWPRQELDPIYIWNNTGKIVAGWGGHYFGNQSGGRVAANRDYYPQAAGIQTSPLAPFDGTSGTGWGTKLNRPVTCSPGVAYFATDEGNWNKSSSNPHGVQQNGANGVLYKCTAPNVWTLFYTPYTYPHPLRN